MQDYQEEFARVLAESGALFFSQGLKLKDGRSTPYFVNLGLFRSGRLVSTLGSFLARMLVDQGLANAIDVLVGPSYKGSALAVVTAQALWAEHGLDVCFEYDRKEIKAHGEASILGSQLVTGALFHQARLFIIDDVSTTMGTKYELIRVLQAEAKHRKIAIRLTGVAVAIDREQTTAVKDETGQLIEGVKGEDAIAKFTAETGVPVLPLAGIRDVVRYLAAEQIPVTIGDVRRPIDPATMASFEEYMNTYGVAR